MSASPAIPQVLVQTVKELSILSEADEFAGGWQLVKVENESRIWWNAGTRTFKCSRFLQGANVSMDSLIKLLTIDVKNRKKWDPGCLDARLINSTGNVSLIHLTYFPYSWWTWPRDYCLLQCVHREKNGTILIGQQSVVDTACPPDSIWKTVRGNLGSGGFILKATESATCIKISFLCSLNLNGMLQWLPGAWLTSLYFQHLNSTTGLQLLLEDRFSALPSTVKAAPQPKERSTPSSSVPVKQTPAPQVQPQPQISSSKEEEVEEELTEDEYYQEILGEFPYPPAIPQHYIQAIETAMKSLLRYAEETDWNPVKTVSDVEISKKEFPGTSINCVRGTGIIPVPAASITDMFKDFSVRTEWEPMFEKNEVIEDYGENTFVMRMMYKGVWPVGGRDFCNFTHGRLLKDGRHIVLATSVLHDRCPETRSHVRAHCVVGGYLFTPLKDPMKCHALYVTQVDLKGNIPSTMMNIVSTQQPLNIDTIRKFMKKINISKFQDMANPYTPLPKTRKRVVSPQEPRQVSAEAVVPPLQERLSPSSNKSATPSEEDPTETLSTQSEPDKDDSVLRSSSSSSLQQLDSGETDPNLNEDKLQPTFNPRFDEIIEQSFASLQQQWDLSFASEWKHVGTKNGIIISRKEAKQGSLYSFKGVGEIEGSPEQIKDVLINVHRASEWDSLFKQGHILETINDTTRVVHLMYQTKMCLLKAARDFCILQAWRQQPDGSILVLGRSVDYPCPLPKDFLRAEILESGYLIQRKASNPNVSEVTYIVQVDLKGIPNSIINVVGERQPLVIAGVKKVVEKKI